MALSSCPVQPLLVQGMSILSSITRCSVCMYYLHPCRCVICHRSKTALLWTVQVPAQPWLLLPLCCLLSCLQKPFSFYRDFRWQYRLLMGQISLISVLDFLLWHGHEISLFVMYLTGAEQNLPSWWYSVQVTTEVKLSMCPWASSTQLCKIVFVDYTCKYTVYSLAQKALLAHPTTLKLLIDLTTLKSTVLGKFAFYLYNLHCFTVKWHFLICPGKTCSFWNLFRMAALHPSCQLVKLFWTLLWLQRIIYWTVKLVKPSQKLQCKAVTSMILLKIPYRSVIFQEQIGYYAPPSLVGALPSHE